MNTSGKYRQLPKTENPKNAPDGHYVKNPKRSVAKAAQRVMHSLRKKLPFKKGSKKNSNGSSPPALATAGETPQSFNASSVQSSVEHGSAESDLIDLHTAENPTSLTIVPHSQSTDSLVTDVQVQMDRAESATCLAGYETRARFPNESNLVSRAQSVPELSTASYGNANNGIFKAKILNSANVSMGSVANCDSAYASAMALDDQAMATSGEYSEHECEHSQVLKTESPETVEETPQSFDASSIQSSLLSSCFFLLFLLFSAESDLTAFPAPEKPAPHIPFPGKSKTRANRTKSTKASSLVSKVVSVPTSPSMIPQSPSTGSLETNVLIQGVGDLGQSATCLAGYSEENSHTYISVNHAKIPLRKLESTLGLVRNDLNIPHAFHNPQANVPLCIVANRDSAYVSETEFNLNDAHSLSSSNGSSETDSTPSSSCEEQECDEETQKKHLKHVSKYKKNSLSSTAPLIPPNTSTETAKKSKKQTGDFYQQLVTVWTVIGNLTNEIGYLGEDMVRLQLNDIKEFGPEFSPSVKITSLYKAIEHTFETTGIPYTDIKAECIKIRNALKPIDDITERVTGIQKDILLWFLNRMKTYKHTCTAKLEDHLKLYPWLGTDGRVSLQNVRSCIKLVHKNLRSTLAFLAQTIDWNDVVSFGSAKPKENKKGRACGHGWYFLIHYSLASYCKAVNASNAEQEKLMPFPPSGELELDVRGRIQRGTQAITIEIGEIKASTKGVEKGYIQLKRSLLISAFLYQLIHEDASVPFILKGYIFVAGKTNKKNYRIVPEEKLYRPAGTLHCQVRHPPKYKPAH